MKNPPNPPKKISQVQNPFPPDKQYEAKARKDNTPDASSGMLVEAHSQQFRGPLPHPDILERYDQIVPGSAKSIIDSFIVEGTHRRARENREVAMCEEWARADVDLQKRGQVLGFILAVIGIGGGLGAIVMGATVSGAVVSSASLAAMVVAFLRQRHTGNEEPAAKSDEKKDAGREVESKNRQ